MTKNEEIVKRSNTKTILGGALIGAATGLVAAVLLSRKAEKKHKDTPISATEGIKIGLLVFGLLRAVQALGDD
jgi:gas vesicle protein